MLTAIETTATIGANRLLLLDEDLPENASSKVRVIVLFGEDDLTEKVWNAAAADNDVFDFLKDGNEDIYTLEDGKPLSNEI